MLDTKSLRIKKYKANLLKKNRAEIRFAAQSTITIIAIIAPIFLEFPT